MNVVILELAKFETNKFGFNLEGNLQPLSTLLKAVAQTRNPVEVASPSIDDRSIRRA